MDDIEVTIVVEKYGSLQSGRWYKQIDPPEPPKKPKGPYRSMVIGPTDDELNALLGRREVTEEDETN